MVGDNKTLGRFILDGIPPTPRGIPQIEVSFDIDANGILNVNAKDKATGKEQSIRIEASSGIPEEEIEKMKKQAEAHAGEDKKKKELIDARNMADSLVYTTEKTIKEFGEKVKAEDKKEIESKIEALKKIKDSDNLEEIKKASEELSQAIQKVGTELYKAQQEAQKKEQEHPDVPPASETTEDKRAPDKKEKKDEEEKK